MAMKKLLARDIMSRKLVTVLDDQPVTELARTLTEHHISGAPVLDRKQRLVGVVSASDIVSHELKAGHEVVSEIDFYARPDLGTRAEMAGLGMHVEDYADALVRDIMSPIVISAPLDASADQLARLMGVNRIHRVLIVDGERIEGVVSALDLVGLLPPPSPAEATRTVLWATDFDARVGRLGRRAVELARSIGARLVVLHVTPNLSTLMRAYGQRPELREMQQGFEQAALEHLHSLARQFEEEGLELEILGLSGDPATTILQVASERQPDYIVIGAQRPSGERLPGLGSVAEKILVAASTAVVTVPPQA
jgi:CBS domain-containing protein